MSEILKTEKAKEFPLSESHRFGKEIADKANNILKNDLVLILVSLLGIKVFFKQIGNSFGIVNEQATIMSRNLTMLAYDYSSLFNTDVEIAAEKFQSAIRWYG